MTRQLTRCFALALLVPGAACFHSHRSSASAAAAPQPAALAKAPVAKPALKVAPKTVLPSEANVAAILLAANNSDLSYAKIAGLRAETPEVKDYVARMTRDDATVNQLISDVMAKIRTEPAEDNASLAYRDQSAMNREMLRMLNGRTFDSAYVANEVAHHSKLLDAIDNSLTPAARAPELKQLLTALRPVVVAERDHAEQVRRTLAAMK